MTVFEMYNKFFDTDMPIIYYSTRFVYAFTVEYNARHENYADILSLDKYDNSSTGRFLKFDTDIPRLYKVKEVYDNTHLKLLKEDL